MPKICLISKDTFFAERFGEILERNGFQYIVTSDDNFYSRVEDFYPDVIVVDDSRGAHQSKLVLQKLKIQLKDYNIPIIFLAKHEELDVMNLCNSTLIEPVSETLFLNCINSLMKTKKTLDTMSENYKELSRSLYQLNVLYNTSSQFAGTLDKAKLFQIMHEGLEKSLGFDISCILFFLKSGANLVINSLHPISEQLEEALILRAMMAYKDYFVKKNIPYIIDRDKINITKNVKPSVKFYDLSAFNFDNLYSPIEVSENFFGLIEIYRASPFSREDVTCFQTIVHQAALPLRSATFTDEIKQKNVKLQKLERLKSEFISIVSHELRTPLTSINSSLEIIKSEKTGVLSPQKEKFLDMAKRNAKRLQGIINDLLDLSKAEAGKLDFRFEKTGMVEVIESVKANLEHLAKAKNIEIDLKIEKDLPLIYADPQRLEQILTNLVSNAIKFTLDKGNISICARKIKGDDIEKTHLVTRGEIEGDYVAVSVKDSGIGINKEDIPKAFDMFLQIENSLSREVGGTGLGLSITRQLVENHFGAIWVKSELEKGAEFSFAIPVLSDLRTFLLDLSSLMLKAKANDINTALICIQEDEDCGFIQKLKDANLIKQTTNSLELIENGRYFLSLQNVERSVLDFVKKRLESFYYEKRDEIKKCDILYGIAVCPDEAGEAVDLYKTVLENMKKLGV